MRNTLFFALALSLLLAAIVPADALFTGGRRRRRRRRGFTGGRRRRGFTGARRRRGFTGGRRRRGFTGARRRRPVPRPRPRPPTRVVLPPTIRIPRPPVRIPRPPVKRPEPPVARPPVARPPVVIAPPPRRPVPTLPVPPRPLPPCGRNPAKYCTRVATKACKGHWLVSRAMCHKRVFHECRTRETRCSFKESTVVTREKKIGRELRRTDCKGQIARLRHRLVTEVRINTDIGFRCAWRKRYLKQVRKIRATCGRPKCRKSEKMVCNKRGTKCRCVAPTKAPEPVTPKCKRGEKMVCTKTMPPTCRCIRRAVIKPEPVKPEPVKPEPVKRCPKGSRREEREWRRLLRLAKRA